MSQKLFKLFSNIFSPSSFASRSKCCCSFTSTRIVESQKSFSLSLSFSRAEIRSNFCRYLDGKTKRKEKNSDAHDAMIEKRRCKDEWLWLSWQSGRFPLLRYAVRIQSAAKFTLNVYCQLYGKDENKEIEAEMGPILKKNLRGSITVPPVYFVWIQLLCLC